MRAAQHVVMFRPMDRVPVFHRWAGEWEFTKAPMNSGMEERWNRFYTACGRTLSKMHWVEPNSMADPITLSRQDVSYTLMRFDNASSIGRPCSVCFPGEVGE